MHRESRFLFERTVGAPMSSLFTEHTRQSTRVAEENATVLHRVPLVGAICRLAVGTRSNSGGRPV